MSLVTASQKSSTPSRVQASDSNFDFIFFFRYLSQERLCVAWSSWLPVLRVQLPGSISWQRGGDLQKCRRHVRAILPALELYTSVAWQMCLSSPECSVYAESLFLGQFLPPVLPFPKHFSGGRNSTKVLLSAVRPSAGEVVLSSQLRLRGTVYSMPST